MKRLPLPFHALLAVSILIGLLAPAAPAAQGSADSAPSEESGWVLVSTAGELAYINRNQALYMDRQIRLTNDIDMSGYEWIPLGGNDYEAFSGVFDGRGHRIEGVSIEGGALQEVGFFGRVTGTVRDVGVAVQATGGSYAGGLAGYLEGGTIERVHTRGAVTGGASGPAEVSVVGGIAGAAAGHSTISRAYSSVAVRSGASGNQFAGGLVGSQGAGEIRDAYAIGPVTNSDGLYYTAGGLTGHLIYASVKNSYSAGPITAAGDSPHLSIGAFSGHIADGVSIAASYFDYAAAGVSNGTGNSPNDPIQLTGRSTADMKVEAHFGEPGSEWDFSTIWAVHPDVNGGYPYLRPYVLTSELPQAVRDAPYSLTLEAFDGAGGGLSWSASGLPAGMQLTADGVLQGAPSVAGAFTVTVMATDAGQRTASADLQLRVEAAAPDIAGFRIGPGQAYGTAAVTASPSAPEHRFAYLLDGSAGARPLRGAPLPDEAILYPLGSDIPVSEDQILRIYETDEHLRIAAWTSVRIEASHRQDQIRVTGVSLDAAELTMTADQPPQRLTAVVEPGNATNRKTSWSSGNPAVAEVDENGNVTPVAEGTAVITVTTEDGFYTASATVTVRPIEPTAASVTGSVYGTGGVPLAGAAVSADGKIGRTNEEGRFTLTNVTAGVHTLSVTAPGYVAYSAAVTAVAGETADVGRIDLVAASASGPSGGSGGGASAHPAPTAPEPDEMTLTVNGREVRLTVIRERENDGRTVIRFALDAELLRSLYASGGEAVVDIDNGDPVVKVDLPAGALQDISALRSEAFLRIGVNGASYRLPLRLANGVPHDSVVTVAISRLTEDARRALNRTLTGQGYGMLAEPADFTLYRDGEEWDGNEGVYTRRTLALHTEAESDRSTVVWVDSAGRLHFVPAVFRRKEAIFYAPHNSLFAAIRSERAFADASGHWGQADIELLASKLIVDGTSKRTFDPDRTVTRAEFAAMLVRALGLVEMTGRAAYSDVRPGIDWYAGAVEAATKRGLIEGYEDGTFRPNAFVTREQMAVMLARAIRFAGELPQADSGALERFADHTAVAGWAKEAAAQLLAAGVVEGVGRTAFAPKQPATRAQSAVMLTRTLRYLTFID
ncbi:S-layer homology domain-containing protein [Cohnella hongkongensis]|uniref:S-layer homology domain-containing protein n=1 Tax=Cohnella hongkongensis TaxID=178337 RepID=A0ABV9F7A5_9BACL